jgi:hypothetical protein
MAREITEVWVITPPKMKGGIQWPIQLHREEQFARSIHEEHVKVGMASTIERLPLLTPHDAAVLEEAETVDRETVVALREAVQRLWDHDEYAGIRATMTHAANYMMAMLDVTRARRAANAGGEG